MKEFNLGQPVYFCHCYGEGYGNKTYRWGEIKLGFITNKEYVEARDLYIYTVGTLDKYNPLMYNSKVLGQHLIFEYNNYDGAITKAKELCEGVDND
jgi:hypothetical protein